MYNYLTPDFGTPFGFFGLAHIGALVFIVVFNVFMSINLKRTKIPWLNKRFRQTLAFLLIIQEISLNIWYVYSGMWDIGMSLPLHMCGAGLILSAIMLINNNYTFYEITYFWGLAGATQALLTPDIGDYGFPHYRFLQFFISHGAIVTATIYMTFVEGYRPTWKSWRKALITTVLYAIIIGGFNLLVNGNYLFICHKPLTPSLLDIMGPWPFYLLPLAMVAVVMFTVIYMPFAIKDWISQRKESLSKGDA